MNRKQQQIRIIVIIVCVVILLSGGAQNLTSLQSLGYTTGYEGAKAEFYGIKWNYDSQSGKQEFPLKGTTFHFDADEKTKPNTGACNLEGEMTSVFLPEASTASWVPRDWLDTAREYIDNPIEHYEWEIPEGNNVTTLYALDEYKLKWYFSISAEWDYKETFLYSGAEMKDQRYRDTQIWFKFDLSPIWYFEGADRVYFAIAKIRVSDISLTGTLGQKSAPNKKEKIGDPTATVRVTPMSRSSILPIYYNPFGAEQDRAEKEAYTFEGQKLNPDLFTDQLYSYFTLVDFGTELWTELGGFMTKWKGDVVTVGFDIHVLVAGEWKVQDIQEIPEDYGRTSKTGGRGGLGDFINTLITDPRFTLLTFIGLIALVILVLAIFAPWVLFSIFGLIKWARSGKS